jgi:NAD(P)-dependent dehydrogenase (short-subunit alcohol dehydrogenase family)
MSIRKTALVTGSTSGIELGTAPALAAEGGQWLRRGTGDRRSRIGAANAWRESAVPVANMCKPADIKDMVRKGE